MVDSIDHWATVCVCNHCGNIPENVPLFHCPYKHQYCNSCFLELKKIHRGTYRSEFGDKLVSIMTIVR